MEEYEMKYVNPEYVSIIAVSEDVLTASMDIVQVKLPQGTKYTQEEKVYYNDDKTEIEKKETTIYLGLDALGI